MPPSQPKPSSGPVRRQRRRCMLQPDRLADPGSPVTASPVTASPVTASTVPAVPGILTAEQLVATGLAIAADQQADGSIGWPDGHVDAWNHVECAMALSVCGLHQ